MTAAIPVFFRNVLLKMKFLRLITALRL